MKPIHDALELLTAQHDELDSLLEKTDSVPDAQRALALGQFADKLTTHLLAEEQLLRVLNVKDYADDHDRVRTALAEVLALDLNSAEMPERLLSLAELLSKHATWQEDILFVMLAETVDPDVLGLVGDVLGDWAERSSVIAA